MLTGGSMRHMVGRLLAAVVTAAGALVTASTVGAQSAGTGAIEGVVTDSSGGALAGVTVVVRNSATNIAREVQTDGGGRYRALALQPGRYDVTAALPGFVTRPQNGVEALVGVTVTVDFQMRPGTVTEEVTVTAEAPLLDSSRTDVSSVVSETAIQNLPING